MTPPQSLPKLLNNQLSGWSYDAAGNLLSDGLGDNYTYNGEGMIISVSGTNYVYDGEGNRVEKSGSAATDYVYFGGHPLARLSGGNWTDLIYGAGGSLVAEVPGTQTGTPVYRMLDHLGTAAGTLSSTGVLLSTADYAPFGQTFSGGTADPYKFTGKERDIESGNDYFGGRYYASNMARFMSPDLPFADQDPTNPQSWNLYGYVRNNPLNSIDNDGLLTILVPGTLWHTLGGWGSDNPLFDLGNGPLRGVCLQDCTQLLDWSGGLFDSSRIEGAQILRQVIAAHRFAPGEKLNIITHSHGGNVALAASHLGLSHNIDTLITLNKPELDDDAYVPGNNMGNFFNISSRGDQWQADGSDVDNWRWAYDPHAVNRTFDTSTSHLTPHTALIWDRNIMGVWWNWFLGQQGQTVKLDNGCAKNPNGECIYSPIKH